MKRRALLGQCDNNKRQKRIEFNSGSWKSLLKFLKFAILKNAIKIQSILKVRY